MRHALILMAALALSGCSSTLVQRARGARSSVHVAFSAELHDARVLTDSTGVIAPATSSPLISFNLAVQPRRGIGLGAAGRLIGIGGDAPRLIEGSLLLGARTIALDVGLGSRTGPDPDKPDEDPFKESFPFAKLGVRSRWNLGQTPFAVQFGAARYMGINGQSDNNAGASAAGGWAGETTLSWTQPGSPFTASAGYRIDRFESYGMEQEVSALTVGLGVVFGRR